MLLVTLLPPFQLEVNKKREVELQKLRKNMDEAHQQHEQAMAQARQKFNTQLSEAEEEMDQVKKAKAR